MSEAEIHQIGESSNKDMGVQSPFPWFEGRRVDAAHLRIAGTTPLDEMGDVVVSVDDRVRLTAEYKVVGVRHYVDPRTGDLIREQILKPLFVELAPWDPSDPNDDGVIRSHV